MWDGQRDVPLQLPAVQYAADVINCEHVDFPSQGRYSQVLALSTFRRLRYREAKQLPGRPSLHGVIGLFTLTWFAVRGVSRG